MCHDGHLAAGVWPHKDINSVRQQRKSGLLRLLSGAWCVFLIAQLVTPLHAADSALPSSDAFSTLCGGATLTASEILLGRYPDPERLDVPAPCKVKARQR